MAAPVWPVWLSDTVSPQLLLVVVVVFVLASR